MKTKELENLAETVIIELACPGVDSYRHTILKGDIEAIRDYFDKRRDLRVEIQSSEAINLTDLGKKYCAIFSRRRAD